MTDDKDNILNDIDADVCIIGIKSDLIAFALLFPPDKALSFMRNLFKRLEDTGLQRCIKEIMDNPDDDLMIAGILNNLGDVMLYVNRCNKAVDEIQLLPSEKLDLCIKIGESIQRGEFPEDVSEDDIEGISEKCAGWLDKASRVIRKNASID